MSLSGGGGIRPVRRSQPSNITRVERDLGLPESYPHALTANPHPLHFSLPPLGRRAHRQEIKFTPWILNLTSETHKCADLNLFRAPKPQPPASSTSSSSGGGHRGTASRSRQRAQGSSNGGGRAHSVNQPGRPRRNPLRRGTVVLPILPGPKRRMPFLDVSVMTLSNVLYTPGKKYSELSWKVLEQQGFTRHVLHDDHIHDITHRTSRENAIQDRDGANRLRIAGAPIALEDAPRPGRNSQGGGRLDKESSVIRHAAIPGVDLLWCVYDHSKDSGMISVHMTAAAMVDMQAWSWGVENGIVGKSAGFNAGDANGQPVAWIARYGGNAPDEEPEEGDVEDLFRRIVQGGLLVGEDLAREMEMGR